jgi:uroporphyrinogen decarboxylase
MTGKERVLRTIEFRNPDKIPVDLWLLPAAKLQYGKRLEQLLEKHERDIASIGGPFDHGFTPEYFIPGTYTDPWGSVWTNRQAGLLGEVKNPVIKDLSKLDGYRAPVDQFLKEWKENKIKIDEEIAKAREKEKFILGGWISIFERMQFLRGTENLYCDIALDEGNDERIAKVVMEFWHAYLDKWLECDIDGVAFGDDWGSQRAALISPETFEIKFKPLYKELITKIKKAGKKVFFHSDGYILDFYQHLVDLGVDAVNSQLWCMGVEKVAARFAGKITFWGEISRQDILPRGTPADVYNAAQLMKKHLFVKGGGLIGESEINRDVPFENIEALLRSWNQ